MKASRWLQVWLILLIASGCASSDWIEGTLVTVDVTGRWAGQWSGSGSAGNFEMILQQNGPKVTGNVRLLEGSDAHRFSGPVWGTLSGDVLTFGRADWALRGEVTVALDEMSGTVTFTPVSQSACCPGGVMAGTKAVKIRRQP